MSELQDNMDNIMRATTPLDAANLYDAINIADAGGMGEKDELDVGSEDAKSQLIDKGINMYDVLDLSAQWDMLAYELTKAMPITFEIGYPTFNGVKQTSTINNATVQTFLTILSIYPDTLIARKYDVETAQKVSEDARLIIAEGGILSDKGVDMINDFDKDLVKKSLNPGTTADLTASSVMVALLDEYNDKFQLNYISFTINEHLIYSGIDNMNEMELQKIIDELHIYEKKVLKGLELEGYEATPEEIVKSQNMDIKSVMSAAGILESRGLIKVQKDVQDIISLTDNGKQYAEQGLPERTILKSLDLKNSIPMKEISKETGLNSF